MNYYSTPWYYSSTYNPWLKPPDFSQAKREQAEREQQAKFYEMMTRYYNMQANQGQSYPMLSSLDLSKLFKLLGGGAAFGTGIETFLGLTALPAAASMTGVLEAALPTLATAIFSLSSAKYKKDISQISSDDEAEISNEMLKTPLFKYRYKFESDDTTQHLGMIAETSPEEVTMFNQDAVGLYEYISALHATIKEMARKIKKLEDKHE